MTRRDQDTLATRRDEWSASSADPLASSSVTVSTTPDRLAPTRLLRRLHGVEHEAELAKALERWRPMGMTGAEGARFILGGRLGQGSQGVVFALRDRDAQRTVALKTLNGRELDADEVSRFLHEVQVTAQLEHPGVVPVHDVGVLPDGTVFYTMKRVEGMVLTDWMSGRAGVAAHRFEVIQLFLKICDTMAFAHSRGVVHRDLKPRNIMVGTYGEVLVMDWGLAKVVGSAEPRLRTGTEVQLSDAADHETLAGTAVGTPAYMSPEQALGQLDRVDHRSDIYGLGVLLYELLANASPYIRGDLRRTIAQVVAGSWMPLDRQPACQRLPRRLTAIVHRCLAQRMDDRYQHVSELTSDLRAFLAGESVSAYRESMADTLARLIDRNRRGLAWAAAGVVVVAALSTTAWWWQERRAGRAVDTLRADIARAVAQGDWGAARKASEGILAFRPHDREAQQAAVRFDERVRGLAEARAREATQADIARRNHARAAQLRGQAAAAAARGGLDDLAEAAQLAKEAQLLHREDAATTADYERYVAELSRLQAQREQASRREAEQHQRRDSAAAFATAAAEAQAQGDLDAAIGALRSAIELEADPARIEQLGVLVAARGERRAASERSLREDEQRAERDRRRAEAEAQFDLADQALAAHEPHLALAHVERAAALVPDHPRLAAARASVADGQRAERIRRAEADLTLAQAATTAANDLRTQLSRLDEEVRRLRRELDEDGEQAQRAALAGAEDAVRAGTRDRAARLAEAAGLLNRALARAADHPPVRAALAAFWVDRLREAEAGGDLAAAAAAEAQAAAFDDGAWADLLAGLARVANQGQLPLRLSPIVRQADRTDGTDGPAVEVPPGGERQVRHGRYLALASDGTRLAVTLERGRTHALALPTRPLTMPPGAVFVPGGRLRDAAARETDEVRPFVCQERETTCGEWLEFLNDPPVLARIDEALARGELILAPRATAYAREPAWRRRSGFVGRGGPFTLDLANGRVNPATPVSGISHDDAVAYATWRARRDGLPWRLPTVAEWQFAVQGGDGRPHPWGAASDLLFAASGPALARDQSLAEAPGGRFALDRSVQGVLDLAGSRSEFCAGESTLGLRPLLGGSLYERLPERFTAWSRRDVDRRLVHQAWSVRLVYSP